MSKLYKTVIRRWFLPFGVGLLTLGQSAAQGTTPPIYSYSGKAGATVIEDCRPGTLGGIFCYGTVSNPELATDDDFTTAATMNLPLTLLSTRTLKLRLSMDGLVPAGHRAGVVVARDGGALGLGSLSLGSTITLSTYLTGSGGALKLQETKTISADLAELLLGESTGPMPLEFTAGEPFDQMEIAVSSLVGLGYKLKVFYAYGIGNTQLTTANGYVSRFATPTDANYSTRAVANGTTLCLNSAVSSPQLAVNNDLTDYATMGTLVGLSCPATLQTQLEGTAPAGYYAGFVLGSAGVLDAQILAGLRLNTYLGTALQETGTDAGLLNLSVLPGGKYHIRMATTKPFDRVEIQRTSLLNLLDNLRVYYGFGLEPRVFDDQNRRISTFLDPAARYQVNGGLCVSCGIDNPALAVDRDLTTNAATYNALLAVGANTRLKMQLNAPARAGNRAGVVLGLATGLLDADLLSSIQINTYSGVPNGAGTNGSVLVESFAKSDLLTAELLASGQREVSFRTTRAFDWVEVQLTKGIGALTGTSIYYAFAEDDPIGFPSVIVPPVTSPVTLTSFAARTSDAAIDVNWTTSAEANSSHFIVQRSLSPNGSFQDLGRVNAAGNSASVRSYQYRDIDGIALAASALYYRLRQIDLDGQESFSVVATVALQPPVVFELYPNPVPPAQQVRMKLPTGFGAKYQVALYNQLGREVSRQTVGGTRTTLSTEALTPGLYQVTLLGKSGQRLATQRLLVQ